VRTAQPADRQGLAAQGRASDSTALVTGIDRGIPSRLSQYWQRWSWIVWAAVAGFAAYILFGRLRSIDVDDLWRLVSDTPLTTLLAALLCCALAFVMTGCYEIAAARLLAVPLAARYAFVTGCISSAIGHCTGAAMVGAGLIRLRRLSPLGWSPQQVSALSLLGAMPFMLGVGWLLDVALILGSEQAARALHLPAQVVYAIGWAGLAKDVAWLLIVWRRRRPLAFANWQLQLPSLRHSLLQVAVGTIETFLVANILFLFLEPSLDIGLPAFVAVYVLGIVVSVISHVPAGLGVLEATLLLLLPQVPPVHLIGAVLMYRAVFELVPLAFGVIALTLGELQGATRLRIADRPHVPERPH
jgi:uncharacterized membrane protein YbhN (UPF0104 family)